MPYAITQSLLSMTECQSTARRTCLIRVSKWLLNFSLPFVAAGFGLEVIRTLTGGLDQIRSEHWVSFLLGGALFIPFWLVTHRYVRPTANYLVTLEHELTHILVGLLFFKRPLSIRVTTRSGGQVVLTGTNLWITLAPYYFPTLAFLALAIALVTGGEHRSILLAALGSAVSYHLLSTWSELEIIQTDFRKAGLLQSLWLIPVANLVLYGSIIAYVTNGFDGLFHYWRAGGANVVMLLPALIRALFQLEPLLSKLNRA
jgi:hypothetical protein